MGPTRLGFDEADCENDLFELIVAGKVGSLDIVPQVEAAVECDPYALDVGKDAHRAFGHAVCRMIAA